MFKLILGYVVMMASVNLVLMDVLAGNILGLVWSIPGFCAWYIIKDIKTEVVKADGKSRYV